MSTEMNRMDARVYVEQVERFTVTYANAVHEITYELPVSWSDVLVDFYGGNGTYEDYKKNEVYIDRYETPFQEDIVQHLDTSEMNKLARLYVETPEEERKVFVYRMTVGLSDPENDVSDALELTKNAVIFEDCENLHTLGFELFKLLEVNYQDVLKLYGTYMDFEAYAVEKMKHETLTQVNETTWLLQVHNNDDQSEEVHIDDMA